MSNTSQSGGYTLLEILVTLVLAGLIATTATPRVGRIILQFRVDTVLNQISAELFYARMLAVRTGRSARLDFVRAERGNCVSSLTTSFALGDGPSARTVEIADDFICVRHTGGPTLVFNSRGMLRPPSRSIIAGYGGVADTLRVSIAGRLRRSD